MKAVPAVRRMAWRVLRGPLRTLCLTLAMFVVTAAHAATLDDAITLVLAHHPVLLAEQVVHAEQHRAASWTSAVNVGWTARGTDYGGAAGLNTGLTLRIPLFDRAREIKRAAAEAGLARTREAVLSAFLTEVERLRNLSETEAEAAALRQLARDRLDYWRHAVEEGEAEAARLWPEVESYQRAEHAERAARSQWEGARTAIARRFGGDAWTNLSALLAAITH